MQPLLNVYLLIGQSNMAGRGRLAEVPRLWDPRALMFRDGRWAVAEEPLHTDKPAIAGVGLGASFAATLLVRRPAAAPVGLIPAAVGGTPLSRWMPGADLFEAAVSATQCALAFPAALRGILWHQGEGDSKTPQDADSYGSRFATMVQGFRERLAAERTPVLAGGLGDFLARRPGCPLHGEVNRHLEALEGVLPDYGFVPATGLLDNGDALHFNAASLREFGIRYAAKLLALTRP